MASSTDQSKNVFTPVEKNTRGKDETLVKGKHVSVEDLKKHNSAEIPDMQIYLVKDMPKYPTPVEFHVSNVAHATDEEAFPKILQSEGFKAPNSKVVWWSLIIQQEEINSAEKRYLQKIFPNQPQEQIESHKPFLHNFTNSPAFQPESRYGTYRFTFPLAELMKLYQEQHCGGEEPVLRVMNTLLYKQEIVYGVLVHSPKDDQSVRSEFGDLPLLEESKYASYQGGNIIWHAQAVSNNLQFSLSVNTEEARVEAQPLGSSKFYVWDHVCLAFYFPKVDKTLKVPRRRLIEAVEACKLAGIDLSHSKCKTSLSKEERYEKAVNEVKKLKKELVK